MTGDLRVDPVGSDRGVPDAGSTRDHVGADGHHPDRISGPTVVRDAAPAERDTNAWGRRADATATAPGALVPKTMIDSAPTRHTPIPSKSRPSNATAWWAALVLLAAVATGLIYLNLRPVSSGPVEAAREGVEGPGDPRGAAPERAVHADDPAPAAEGGALADPDAASTAARSRSDEGSPTTGSGSSGRAPTDAAGSPTGRSASGSPGPAPTDVAGSPTTGSGSRSPGRAPTDVAGSPTGRSGSEPSDAAAEGTQAGRSDGASADRAASRAETEDSSPQRRRRRRRRAEPPAPKKVGDDLLPPDL